MKDGTEQKLKFMKLRARLGLRTYAVRGLLDSLWAFTRNNCPAGDVGRFTDEEIALGIDWEGDPTSLICALVDTNWLDKCAQHRLIVHHWAQHCEDSVHRTLARQRQLFADGTTPSLSKVNSDERLAIAADFQALGRPGRGVAKARAPRKAVRHGPGGGPARPGPAQPSLAIARPGPAGAQPEPAPAPSQRAREPELETDPPRGATSGVTGACADGQAGGATAPGSTKPAAGPPARANGLSPTPAQGRLLARVDAGLLRDTPRLVAWIAEASGVDPPLVSASEADRLRVVGAAERALEAGDDPPKLFVATVRSRAWERITQAQEDRAQRRLVEYDRRLRSTDAQRHVLRSKLESIGRAEPKSVQEAR